MEHKWAAPQVNSTEFYMLLWFQYHGGTNFGRTAGGPFIATSYDYDAPLDEYGVHKALFVSKVVFPYPWHCLPIIWFKFVWTCSCILCLLKVPREGRYSNEFHLNSKTIFSYTMKVIFFFLVKWLAADSCLSMCCHDDWYIECKTSPGQWFSIGYILVILREWS